MDDSHSCGSNSSLTPMYVITSSMKTSDYMQSVSGVGGGTSTAPGSQMMHGSCSYEDYEMEDLQLSDSRQSQSSSSMRKRKPSYSSNTSCDKDYCSDSRSSRSGVAEKKQNHSEIEKRRRDKMNTYINELSAMIPVCGAMSRKLDKLTVLRMAVQHLRTVRGTLSACPLTSRPRPAFVSERELNGLLLQAAADAFLLVVSCDRGRLLFVSHSVSDMLHYHQEELLGQSLFDILHPKDVAKVKEQLSSSELGLRERLIDVKTMLPVKPEVLTSAQPLSTGARRSFFCRIKSKPPPETNAPRTVLKEENDVTTKQRKKLDKKYCVVHCTGYLKVLTSTDMKSSGPEGDDDHCTLSCLVAIARALPARMTARPVGRTAHYVSRHAIDGRFLFVDQRVTLALGFLPQELLGTSLYEYVSGPALVALARTHKQALIRRDPLLTPPYSFRRKDGSNATIQTHFKPFRNPWTKEVECLVANNSVMSDAYNSDDVAQNYEAFRQNSGGAGAAVGAGAGVSAVAGAVAGAGAGAGAVAVAVAGAGDGVRGSEMQREIESRMEMHKIGSAIAEEVMRQPPPVQDPIVQEPIFNTSALMDNILGVDMSSLTRNNAPMGSSAAAAAAAASPTLPPLGLDGNNEAAMAVIMSLLEADAGLGGPVNFSGLPWPLP